MNFSFFFGSVFLGSIIIFVGSLTLVLQRLHLLMSLFSLEFMIVGLFLVLLGRTFCCGEGFLVFVLLTFASCEAAIGLGLLIRIVRSHGNDFVSAVGLFEC